MLRIISYNIRYNNPHDGDHAWPYRKERVAQLFRHHQPDLIGLQEVQKNQLDDLIPRLPDYDWVGIGRDDGKQAGEFAAIFYRRDRLNLVDSGTIWLSETPHVVGSVGWDASMARIIAWAEFIDLEDETRLRHVNTHFDHRGETAQLESARLLRRFVTAQAAPLPALVTGDFNCTPTSPPYTALTESIEEGSPLLDAMSLTQTPHQGPTETFNGDFADPLQEKIDYIFVWSLSTFEDTPQSESGIQVLRHAVLDDQEGGYYPSDHLPVMADILICNRPAF